MSGALIVTAELAGADLGWLDHLRKQHYPADRNQLMAHLTMFHALPPSSEAEVRGRLGAFGRLTAPKATVAGLMNLGGGVAFRIVSDELDAIRNALAEDFHGLLSAQDAHGWRPHVTIQNKVLNSVARELLHSLEREFSPRPLTISGLGLHRYRGGPWDTVATYRFRGVS